MPVMSEQINELAAALAAAQAEMEGAEKNSANPHLKSKYADLTSVWNACRGPLSKHGLAVVQCPREHTDERGHVQLRLETVLMHKSGQWISSEIPVTPAKERDPQALGSFLTYCRRYGLSAMVGIAPDDDDAEAAMRRDAPRNGHGQDRPRRDPGPASHPLDARQPNGHGPDPAPAPASNAPRRTFKQLVADGVLKYGLHPENKYAVARETLGEIVAGGKLKDPGGLLSEEQIYDQVQGIMTHHRAYVVDKLKQSIEVVKESLS